MWLRLAFLEVLQVVLVAGRVHHVGVLLENIHQPLLIGLVERVRNILAHAAVLAGKRVDGADDGQRHEGVLINDGQREEMVGQGEVAAVNTVGKQRVVGHHA